MNIYVGNLSSQTTEEQLTSLFASCGDVKSVKIITDHVTGYSRGFAFVEMTNDEEGQKAIDAINNTDFNSKTITVNEARPKTNDNRFQRNDGNRFRDNDNRFNKRRY